MNKNSQTNCNNNIELGEIWLTYKENPRYKVSNRGRVMGWHGGHNRWISKSLRDDKDGYKTVNVTNPDGKTTTTIRVHRMVASTFIPNPSNCPVVNHKDNVKYNNDASNLEWATIAYNTQYGYTVHNNISAASKFIKATLENGELFSYYQSCARMSKAMKTGRQRAEKSVREGNFLGLLNLEVVDSIPDNAPMDKCILTKKIAFEHINPVKISFKNRLEKVYGTAKEFAQEFNLTQSRAQRVVLGQSKKLAENLSIQNITKLSHREYCNFYLNT